METGVRGTKIHDNTSAARNLVLFMKEKLQHICTKSNTKTKMLCNNVSTFCVWNLIKTSKIILPKGSLCWHNPSRPLKGLFWLLRKRSGKVKNRPVMFYPDFAATLWTRHYRYYSNTAESNSALKYCLFPLED